MYKIIESLSAKVAIAATVVATIIGVMAGPAQAGDGASIASHPINCSSLTDPTNATSKTTVRSLFIGGNKTLELRAGYINGIQYAWTRIVNSTSGDQIWIDFAASTTSGWVQCDLRTLSGGRNYGNALRTVPDGHGCMRAGGRPSGGASYITSWWC